MKTVLIAAVVALCLSLFLMPLYIRLAKKLEWGQFIREDGPRSHLTKRGTPTMGGIVILGATTVAYFVSHLFTEDPITPSVLLALLLTLGLGLVGFIDDFIKVRKHRSLGLGGWAKMGLQAVVSIAFIVLAVQFPNSEGVTPASWHVSFARDLPVDFSVAGPVVGGALLVLWLYLIIASASNGVNVADGLDGLAAGASIMAAGAYVLISYWQFNQWCYSLTRTVAESGQCYAVRDPLDLTVFAAALLGALVGFLWWNTSPAQLFMGDTGSLGIGGAIAALAILTRTELLLVFIGGLFVIVAGSVILQRVYFKLTHGKRIFLMSPLHHHFELKGWAPVTVVVRFWIIAGISAALGVGLFYFEWAAG
ncbi:MAG TPA: phospho-N-acetylmuramoyl-pentapeptide-transferase [Pseudoclavibacter sp.]|nr:phospho-N-acetylmuramoyl-pentapeptide-transferase [Pseudoclavibacter sp.]